MGTKFVKNKLRSKYEFEKLEDQNFIEAFFKNRTWSKNIDTWYMKKCALGWVCLNRLRIYLECIDGVK